MSHLPVAALLLWATALAGGDRPPAQVSSIVLLQGLPGLTVTEAPSGDLKVDSARWKAGATYTYAVRVLVGTQQVRVLLTPGADEGSRTVNGITAYVDAPTASAGQRQALVSVARGFLEGCAPQVAPQAQTIWAGLARHNWAGALGWQDRLLGHVRVGWSGKGGMTNSRREITGLVVTWPGGSGRCVF